ncbi:MAG TPA: SCO family protein [Kofleriaceae bacterium]|nr:SCO family protein [Kofleriaceae bacterium]
MSDPLVPITPSTTPERRRRIRGKRVLLVMLAIVVLGAVPAVVVPILWTRGKPPKLSDLSTIPAFSLIDERGQPFTEEALRHHPTIVSFIFTRCDTVCPITSMKMEKIQDKTFDAGQKIKLLSLSVDPKFDNPERLTAFAAKYHADPERWRFVTGPADAVQALVEGPFLTSMQTEAPRPDGIPNIAHGGYFMLVDGDLHIRGMYESNDIQRLDELIRDARYLARIAK